MDLHLFHLLQPAVVFATLLGVAFGVKLLVWGKGPLKRVRGGSPDGALERRVAELGDRCQQLTELLADQERRLEDHDERLDFAERLLTRQRADKAKLALPPESPPR
jgi:hypothetical protein